MRLHTLIWVHRYAFKKKKTRKPNEHSFSGWTVEHCTTRMTRRFVSRTVLTLFFYRREHDVHSFHYFRISALKANLRVSNPLISVLLFSSLCMQPHFLLDWNASNRSFFFAHQLSHVDMQLVEIVRLYSELTTIRFESIVRGKSRQYRRNENVAGKRFRRNWKDR